MQLVELRIGKYNLIGKKNNLKTPTHPLTPAEEAARNAAIDQLDELSAKIKLLPAPELAHHDPPFNPGEKARALAYMEERHQAERARREAERKNNHYQGQKRTKDKTKDKGREATLIAMNMGHADIRPQGFPFTTFYSFKVLIGKDLPKEEMDRRAFSTDAETARRHAKRDITEGERIDHVMDQELFGASLMRPGFGSIPFERPFETVSIGGISCIIYVKDREGVNKRIEQQAHEKLRVMGLASKWSTPKPNLSFSERMSKFLLDRSYNQARANEHRRKIAGHINSDDRDDFKVKLYRWLEGFPGAEHSEFIAEEIRSLHKLPKDALDKFLKLDAHKELAWKGFSCLLPPYRDMISTLPSSMKNVAGSIPA